ncbi:hypothetical protein HOG21_03845 [bacterium]|nr:hypothetical protein [bacterium]
MFFTASLLISYHSGYLLCSGFISVIQVLLLVCNDSSCSGSILVLVVVTLS